MTLAPTDRNNSFKKNCLAPCPPDTPCECREYHINTNMDVNSSYWQLYESQSDRIEREQKQQQYMPSGR